ncbi:MAG: hypothetical protein QOE23_821 [Pseudonocardiales bacterium]|nr:hypothetical protein [Pseudonocardiales bacterium]
MNDYEPTGPHETLAARPVSSAMYGPSMPGSPAGPGAAPPPPPTASPDKSEAVTMANQARWPRLRRLLSKKITWIAAAALTCAVIALSIALGTSSTSTTPTSAAAGNPAPGNGAAGRPGFGGGGSNARSGPAAGGASGTVASMSTSGFTLTTATGQKVTVNEASSTTYQNGTSSTAASSITTGEPVLVLGTTNGTTITATQVTVQSTGSGGTAASSAAGVIPFQQGAPTTSKQVGQVPTNYTEGSGTIVSGTTANKATEAALAAYPGGVVDRVVQLSNGEYEVHNIGVNWPHHVFVSQSFQVLGAD